MGSQSKFGCVSGLLSQEVGGDYYYVRLVADNIQLLQDLAAELGVKKGDFISIVRGTTSIVAHGSIMADPDNSHIAVTPEVGNEDDILTIDGDPDGRVLILVPASEAFTLTLKPQVQVPIVSVDPALNEFTVVGHGLTTGQLIGLFGEGLPDDVAPGAYYAVATGVDTFRIATSKANALANTVVEIVNAGEGYLEIGNIKIDGDLELTGRHSAMFVKDGTAYTLLGTSAAQPALVNLVNTRQPLNGLLTQISNLVLDGKAGKLIEVNATGDGLAITGYDLDDVLLEIDGKAPLAHSHSIDKVVGLQDALDAKQPLNDDLTAIAALATQAFGRGLLELADLAALKTLVGVGSGGVAPGEVPHDAASITLASWNDKMTLTTPTIPGAVLYRWRIYLADGVTLKREVLTETPKLTYTNAEAGADGISRSYKIQVAGVNDNGVGGALMSATLNKPAPAAPTGVVFTGDVSSGSVTFTPSSDPNTIGYLVAYSTVSGFDPMTQGSMFSAGGSPAYTPQLPAATYYGKVASYDMWSNRPDLINFSAQGSFTVATGTGGAPSGGGGGGGWSGGGGGGLRDNTVIP